MVECVRDVVGGEVGGPLLLGNHMLGLPEKGSRLGEALGHLYCFFLLFIIIHDKQILKGQMKPLPITWGVSVPWLSYLQERKFRCRK